MHHSGLLVVGVFLIFLCNEGHTIQILVGPDLSTYKASLLTLQDGSVTESCTIDFPELPISELKGHSQTFIDGKLVICGGNRPASFFNPFCFQLDTNTQEWLEFSTLPFVKTGAVSMWTDNSTKWWLTGGSNGSIVSTTMYYDTIVKDWFVGPKLPALITGHCLVEMLDGTRLMFAGQIYLPIIGSKPNRYVYKQEVNGSWTNLQPEINTPRFPFSQTCARLPNGDIMLVGGKPDVQESVDLEFKVRILGNL